MYFNFEIKMKIEDWNEVCRRIGLLELHKDEVDGKAYQLNCNNIILNRKVAMMEALLQDLDNKIDQNKTVEDFNRMVEYFKPYLKNVLEDIKGLRT